MTDPQIAHRRAFAEVHDAGGVFQALNPPFQMSDTPAAASAHVAALGENTEELLAEIGYKPSQITDLLNPQHPSP